jgi:pantoate--beta-alanine ligase
MKTIRHIEELVRTLQGHRAEGRSIGWVGTSGALHDGHLSLVRHAKAGNDVAMMTWTGGMSFPWAGSSNPSYGRNEDRDAAMASGAGLDLLYIPIGAEIFPQPPHTRVTTPAMHREGLTEPHHLDMVALFMTKFLSLSGPCSCYMGEKDWQQLVMMRGVISDLSLPVDRLVVVPTARDSDGVPLSSRNSKLTPEQRAAAVVVPTALRAAARAVEEGERDPGRVRDIVTRIIEPVAPVTYAQVLSDTMQDMAVLAGPIRILAAANFGGTDILDNIGLSVSG